MNFQLASEPSHLAALVAHECGQGAATVQFHPTVGQVSHRWCHFSGELVAVMRHLLVTSLTCCGAQQLPAFDSAL